MRIEICPLEKKKGKTALTCSCMGAAIVLALYSLRMVIHSGYYFDDSVTSSVRELLLLDGKSLWSHLCETMKTFPQGRFTPGARALRILVLYAFHDLTYYKAAIMTGIAINVALFGYFLRRITGSINIASLSMLLIPIFFQIRNYHDALTSYFLLMQFLFILLVLSFIFFDTFLSEKKTSALLVSMLFYLLALLTYEVSYAFLALFFILAWDKLRSLAATMKVMLPLFSLFLVMLTVSVYTQRHFPGDYSGLKANLHLKSVLMTFLKQLSGAFPMSYYLQTKQPILTFVTAADVGYAVVLFSLFFFLMKKTARERVNRRALITFGLAFLILPAAVLSLSVKYQKELAFETAYLPVYIEYFGLLMCLLGLYSSLTVRIHSLGTRNMTAGAVALIAAVVGLVNMDHNKSVVENMNLAWKYPREVLESSLRKGILKGIPADSVIITRMQHPYSGGYLYADRRLLYRCTGKKFTVFQFRNEKIFRGGTCLSPFLKADELQDLSRKDAYVLTYSATGKSTGTVLLARGKNFLLSLARNKQKYDEQDIAAETDKVFVMDPGTCQLLTTPSGSTSGH